MSIQSEGLQVVFFKNSPGKEKKVANDALRVLSNFSESPISYNTHFLYGCFDQALIHNYLDFSNHYPLESIAAGEMEYITGINSISGCFLDPSDVPKILKYQTNNQIGNNEPENGKVNIISLARLSRTFVKSKGFEALTEVTEDIKKINDSLRETNPETEIVVCWGLGWADLIIFISSDNIETAFETLLKIRNLKPREDCGILCSVATTISTIGMPQNADCEVVEFKGKIGEVYPLVHMAIRNESSIDIRGNWPEPDKLMSKFLFSIGRSDIAQIFLEPIDLSEFHNKMSVALSQDAIINGLHRSSSVLFFDKNLDGLGQQTNGGQENPEEDMLQQIPKLDPKWREVVGDTIYSRLIQMFATMRLVAKDWYMRDTLEDLFGLINRVAEDIKDLEEHPPSEKGVLEKIEKVEGAINLFLAAYEQRYRESHAIAMSQHGFSPRLTGSSLKKSISAVRKAIKCCFAKAGVEWNSFCLFGYRDDFVHYNYGIINLPLASLFEPETWLLVCHEMGHEVYSQWFEDRIRYFMRFKSDVPPSKIQFINLGNLEYDVPSNEKLFHPISQKFFPVFRG